MNTRPVVISWFTILLIIFWFTFTLRRAELAQGGNVQNGIIDLSKVDFDVSGRASLTGTWEIYPDTLLTPAAIRTGQGLEPPLFQQTPANIYQKTGLNSKYSLRNCATYRLRVLLPKSAVSTADYAKNLGIYLSEVRNTYTLWINGVNMLRQGNIFDNQQDNHASVMPRRVFFTSKTDTLELVVAVANYSGSDLLGITRNLYLGSEEDLLLFVNQRRFFYIFSFGVLFMTALYHLFLSYKRKAVKVNLSFGLATLSLAMQSLVVNERVIYYIWPGLSDNMLQKIWLVSLNFLPLMLYFYHAIYPKETNKTIVHLIGLVAGILTVLIVVLPYSVYASSMSILYMCGLGTTAYMIWISMAAIRHKREYAVLTLIGMAVPLLCSINDLLNALEVIFTGYYLPVAFLTFAVFQSYILTSRFSNLFESFEALNHTLQNLNSVLEEKVAERTHELQITNFALHDAVGAKDKFLSILSHDLKNPFHVLLGYAEMIRDNVESFDKEYLHLLAGSMHDAAEHAYKLLENLLDWSRLQLGLYTPEKTTFALKQVVNSTVQLLARPAELKNITLRTFSDADVTIEADKRMTEAILRNLITNAIKFTLQGGTVTIYLRRLPPMAEIKVQDSGIGMDKEIRSRLFQLNEQISRKGTADETGTGLGLLLIKEFVLLNGGTIHVESEPGQGSVFTVLFPLAEPHSPHETGHDIQQEVTIIQ
jgi:signal transduction histidine kinase